MITSCSARGSTYYIIMTKNVEGFHGKGQSFFESKSWSVAKTKIQENWNNGKIITSICYNSGLEKYLIVMTESTAGQDYEWFNTSEGAKRSEWLKKQEKVWLVPMIFFLDPTDNQLLVVCTTDKSRKGCGYECYARKILE